MNPEKPGDLPQSNNSEADSTTPLPDYRINVGKYASIVALGAIAATAGATETDKQVEHPLDKVTKIEAQDSSLEIVDGVRLKTAGFSPTPEEAAMIVANLKKGGPDLTSVTIMFHLSENGKGNFKADIVTKDGRHQFLSTIPRTTSGSPEEISEMIKAEFK